MVLTGELSSGERFEKTIGERLVFRLYPYASPKSEVTGWSISLTPIDDAHQDYVYPVNPPLRFNELETLGPGYDDTKASLGHPHLIRFLLDVADYERVSPVVTNALWADPAPHPEQTAAEYFVALKN